VIRAAPLGIVALGTVALVLGAGGTRSTEPTLSSTAAAWRGLAGSARPQVDVGQRMIVVLKAPSLAQRVARAGGQATDSQEREWTTAALAAQQQVLALLAQHGVQVRVDYYYSRVINGFSAALDSEAVALLEREPEVAGVYPVRVAYPATVSSRLLAKDELARGAAPDPENVLARTSALKNSLMGVWESPSAATVRQYSDVRVALPKAVADANALLSRAAALSQTLKTYDITLTVPPAVK